MAPQAPGQAPDQSNPEASLLYQQQTGQSQQDGQQPSESATTMGQNALAPAVRPSPSGGATIQERQDAQSVQNTGKKLADAKQNYHQARAQHLRNIGSAALSAAGSLVSSLGDVGAVGTVPAGGGALTGVGRVLGARTQRLQETAKNNALIGEANARARSNNASAHKLEQEDLVWLQENNKDFIEAMKAVGVPIEFTQQNSTQIGQGIKAGKVNPLQHYGVLDGVQIKGQGEDQFHRGTYSLVVPDGTYTLDPNTNPAAKGMIEKINKYGGDEIGGKISTDKPWTIRGDQLALLWSKANSGMVNERTSAAGRAALGVELDKDEAVAPSTRTDIMHFMSENGGNPTATLQTMLAAKRADGTPVYRNAPLDFQTYFGQKAYDSAMEIINLGSTGALTEINDLLKKGPTAKGDELDGLIATGERLMQTAPAGVNNQIKARVDQWKGQKETQNLTEIGKGLETVSNVNEVVGMEAGLNVQLNDPETPVQNKPRIAKLLGIATAKKVAMQAEEDRKFKAEQTAKEGDPLAAGRQLANFDITLQELKTRQVSADYITKATDEAKRLNPDYSDTVADAWAKDAGNQQNATFFGNVYSLVSQNGTLDQVLEASKGISQHDWKILNKIQNWTTDELGKAGLSAYMVKIVGVADDWSKVMGGSVGSDTSRSMVLGLLDPSKSPQQKAAAVEAAKDPVLSQAEGRMGMNPFLRKGWGPMLGITGAKPQVTQRPAGGGNNAPAAGGQQGGGQTRPGQPKNTVYMKRPNGTYMYAKPEDVDRFKRAGATVVQ